MFVTIFAQSHDNNAAPKRASNYNVGYPKITHAITTGIKTSDVTTRFKNEFNLDFEFSLVLDFTITSLPCIEIIYDFF